VKVIAIGGGPGGLFAAILLKKLDPRNDVTVYERNHVDDTFGFGVVFSDATEAALEDADPPSMAPQAAPDQTGDQKEKKHPPPHTNTGGPGL
jgi:anthraniloyl-CoA monooxygenase